MYYEHYRVGGIIQMSCSVKNMILKSITAVAMITMIVSMCLLDSDNWIPFIDVLLIDMLWLTLFEYANRGV